MHLRDRQEGRMESQRMQPYQCHLESSLRQPYSSMMLEPKSLFAVSINKTNLLLLLNLFILFLNQSLINYQGAFLHSTCQWVSKNWVFIYSIRYPVCILFIETISISIILIQTLISLYLKISLSTLFETTTILISFFYQVLFIPSNWILRLEGLHRFALRNQV